ncbi:MAG: hypothetical protein ACYDEN_07790 [Acidimicrobiales bacterium]
MPIATWEKLLAHAEDELDLDVARRRLAERRPWLSEGDLDAALVSAMEKASGSDLSGRDSPGEAGWYRLAAPGPDAQAGGH